TTGPLMASLAPPDEAFGPARTVFGFITQGLNGAAVDNAGNAFVFWAGSGMENVSVLPAGADAFCSPVAIVPNGAAGPVSMALDAGGSGVAVFQRNGSSEVVAVGYRQESGCPSPPPAAVKRARVRVGSRAVVSRTGRSARITLECVPEATCEGSIVLMRRSGATLARRSFTVAAGRKQTLRMRLSRAAVRMIRGRRSVRAAAAIRLRGQEPRQQAVVLARAAR
ncbi:MAG TPA: hypothetical protein VF066_18740, partial [Thermoleophilaceae bacterium]